MPGVVLAVDLGATNVAAARVDADGAVLARVTAPTAGTADEQALFDVVAGAVGAVARGDEVACGIGACGPMTERGARISPVNLPVWRDFPLRDRLADRLGIPTYLDGDGKALVLGESWLGAGRDHRDLLAMVVSTGVGGGIVLDGRLLDGDRGNAGHIGHVVVEPDGRPCGCGGSGCLEAEASGTAIAAVTGRPAAEASIEVRQRTGRLVGQAVASVANLLDLRLAVVAGSVALGFGQPFFTAAQAEVDRRTRLSFSAGTQVVPSTLGDLGPLLGAAALAWRGLDGEAPASPPGSGR